MFQSLGQGFGAYKFSLGLNTNFILNDQNHNEHDPAVLSFDSIGNIIERQYWLFNYCYGTQNDFTDESWTKFAAKVIKLKAFA